MASLPDPMMEPTIRVERAGQLLGISRGTAYEAARTGQLPTLRIGKRLVVPTAALLRLLGVDPEPATAQRDKRPSSRR
jgi:excisionase family DNA binding protein